MTEFILIFLFIIFYFIYYVIIPAQVKSRRKSLKKNFFPSEFVEFLQNNIYLYRILPLHLKLELQDYIKIFLAEKQFIGQNGFILTTEIKISIASQACILLLGDYDNKRNFFPYLKYIYVYPDIVMKAKDQKNNEIILLGLSSVGNKTGKDGVIYLSWTEIARQSNYSTKGENIILHEFAHQLDQAFGNALGMPRLDNLQDSLMWREILGQEYYNHCQATKNNLPTVIDVYGAINPAEFFAVVTEAFFLKPTLLQAHHLLLYEQLKKYYNVNPLEWSDIT